MPLTPSKRWIVLLFLANRFSKAVRGESIV